MPLIKMEVLRTKTVTNNHWTISPGPVGSVGDVNMQVRLKHNMPDAPLRFEKEFSGKNLKYLGSNVQDGSFGSGAPARTIQRKIGIRNAEKTDIGWRKQDIIPVDRTTQPKFAPLGPYTWNNQRAQVFRAKISGQAFLPVPPPYDKTQVGITRGNQVPRVVLTESGGVPTGESLNYIAAANNPGQGGSVVSPTSAGTTPQVAPLGAPQLVGGVGARKGVMLPRLQGLF
jgi:hypothetical protein